MQSFHDDLEEAMAEVRRVRAGVREVQQAANRDVTSRSKDRRVTVTLGPQGELTNLVLHGDRWKTMPAVELCALIVRTAKEARDEMMADLDEVVTKALGASLDDLGLSDPMADLDETVTQMVLEGAPELTEAEKAAFVRSWKDLSA